MGVPGDMFNALSGFQGEDFLKLTENGRIMATSFRNLLKFCEIFVKFRQNFMKIGKKNDDFYRYLENI